MIERLLSRFLQAGLLDSPDADALVDVLMAEGDPIADFSPSQYEEEEEEEVEMEVDEPQEPPAHEEDLPQDGSNSSLFCGSYACSRSRGR